MDRTSKVMVELRAVAEPAGRLERPLESGAPRIGSKRTAWPTVASDAAHHSSVGRWLRTSERRKLDQVAP